MFSHLSSAAGLSPLTFLDGCVLLSTWSGALSALDVKERKLTGADYDFFFSSSLFTIKQGDGPEHLTTHILISGKAAMDLLLPYAIGDFSVLIEGDAFTLLLYDENEALQMALNWTSAEERINRVDSDFPPALIAVSCGVVSVEDDCIVSLWNQTIFSSVTQKTERFSSLHCISAKGILFGVEEEEAVHVRYLPYGLSEPHDIGGDGVNCVGALMDISRNQIIVTEEVSGQHRLRFYDSTSCCLKSISDKLFGSITPIHTGDDVLYYASGSIEGIQLLKQDFSLLACFLPGLAAHRRRYTEYADVKVTSIESSQKAVLNVVFLHGGPESCEWDTPRHYPLLKSLENHSVNFHIVNYPGSAGFGRKFRSIADQQVCEFTSTAVVNWIKAHLPSQPTVLMGWSFGGTLALEILGLCEKKDINTVGVAIINPLLDLPFHLNRVAENKGDLSFFRRKFSRKDCDAVSVGRYKNLIKNSNARILLIAGRNDEVLSSDSAQDLINRLGSSENVSFVLDDGAHGGAESFDAREDRLIAFVKQFLPLALNNHQ
ncbi:alpha/beta hydrolase family protein [Candidatus Pantoea soli]|uniref:Alpha/beta hydrolase n=1 Tax=Candidatus Pantoea soli TaxID=3098669 RepID=A0A518XJ77_9GAMM|nr:alpha/beta hydrolase [Pantoea soli]QDY44251.1 alpha/beta hydrolase [Pantoea soli]